MMTLVLLVRSDFNAIYEDVLAMLCWWIDYANLVANQIIALAMQRIGLIVYVITVHDSDNNKYTLTVTQ